jgi:hypothetical protein
MICKQSKKQCNYLKGNDIIQKCSYTGMDNANPKYLKHCPIKVSNKLNNSTMFNNRNSYRYDSMGQFTGELNSNYIERCAKLLADQDFLTSEINRFIQKKIIHITTKRGIKLR